MSVQFLMKNIKNLIWPVSGLPITKPTQLMASKRNNKEHKLDMMEHKLDIDKQRTNTH